MSKLSKGIIILIIFVGLTFLIYSLIIRSAAINNNTTKPKSISPSSSSQIQSNIINVTTIPANNIGKSFLPTSGKVFSKTLIGVHSAVSGTIKKINFREGDFVKTGDIIIKLTGINGESNPIEAQYQIAKQNYNFAKRSVNNLSTTRKITLQNAQLQLQNAKNQTQAFITNLSVMDSNISSLQQGINLLNNSLSSSNTKTNRDLTNAHQNLNDLISSINEMQSQKHNTIGQIKSLNNYSNTSNQLCTTSIHQPNLQSTSSKSPSTDMHSTLCATYLKENQSLNKLYTLYDKAKLAYNDGIDSIKLGNNQILSQVIKTQGQLNATVATKQSTEQKVGYDGHTIIAMQQAQKAFEATKQQLKAAQDQANNQLQLAKLSYNLAKSQLNQLTIKAPEDGIIAGLDLHINNTVSPQNKLFSILTPADFEVILHVDTNIANQISHNAIAQVQIANQWVDAAISSISPITDARTGLVEVKIALPKIFFRIGQILNVKLPLQITSKNKNSLYLPLDAVTIGTHEQFVYIVDSGHVKKIDVTTGKIVGDQIEILSGLVKNERVILKGAHELIEGQPVTVSSK